MKMNLRKKSLVRLPDEERAKELKQQKDVNSALYREKLNLVRFLKNNMMATDLNLRCGSFSILFSKLDR